jgi:tetratricopeptide (TPR) repeat protein
MLLLASCIKLIAEIALLALLGQWVVGLLAVPEGRPGPPCPAGGLPVVGLRLGDCHGHQDPDLPAHRDRAVPVSSLPWPGRLNAAWLRLQSRVLLVFGQRRAALARFEDLLAMAPHDRHALASRAHVLAELGDSAAAIAAQRAVVDAHADDAAAWFNLGFMLEEAGQLEQAETALRHAVALQPTLDRAWYGLGLVLIRLGRLEEALPPLRKNTELQPMSPYGWYQLARVHAERERPEEAAKIIRHLRRFEPKVAAQLERETGLRTAQ